MGLALFKERRISNRKQLTGLMPGRLVLDGLSRDLDVRPVDVSPGGIGVIIAEELAIGTKLMLVMKDQVVPMTVSWSQRDFGKRDMFRYGLSAQRADDNLEQIFIATGCLR